MATIVMTITIATLKKENMQFIVFQFHRISSLLLYRAWWHVGSNAEKTVSSAY